MEKELNRIVELFGIEDCEIRKIRSHENGRNTVYVVRNKKGEKFVLRVSPSADRTENDLRAETEFVNYLKEHGAPVVAVIPSVNRRFVEKTEVGLCTMFGYARGMLISDNGYRYVKGKNISEYFFNTGKTLGKIHALSKAFKPVYKRRDFFDKYNPDYLKSLIPDKFKELKDWVLRRISDFSALKKTDDCYGLVHFDFNDGNYHVDMENGDITVFDFDNSVYCWYGFDLATLYQNGEGWCSAEDPIVEKEERKKYFDVVLAGYESETELPEGFFDDFDYYYDMVLIENVVDTFECLSSGEELEEDDFGEIYERLKTKVFSR